LTGEIFIGGIPIFGLTDFVVREKSALFSLKPFFFSFSKIWQLSTVVELPKNIFINNSEVIGGNMI